MGPRHPPRKLPCHHHHHHTESWVRDFILNTGHSYPYNGRHERRGSNKPHLLNSSSCVHIISTTARYPTHTCQRKTCREGGLQPGTLDRDINAGRGGHARVRGRGGRDSHRRERGVVHTQGGKGDQRDSQRGGGTATQGRGGRHAYNEESFPWKEGKGGTHRWTGEVGNTFTDGLRKWGYTHRRTGKWGTSTTDVLEKGGDIHRRVIR